LRNAGKSKIAQPEPQVGQTGHRKSSHTASSTQTKWTLRPQRRGVLSRGECKGKGGNPWRMN
jgi:hypothetical protein